MLNHIHNPSSPDQISIYLYLFICLYIYLYLLICIHILFRRNETTTTSKRPSQSVVQVDANGRRYLIAYPAPDKPETKPDILNPKSGKSDKASKLGKSCKLEYTYLENV